MSKRDPTWEQEEGWYDGIPIIQYRLVDQQVQYRPKGKRIWVRSHNVTRFEAEAIRAYAGRE